MKLATIGAVAAAVVVAGSAGVAFWLLPEGVRPARFVASDCRRVDLRGPDGPIFGAEDIVLSGDGEYLYVSAYDRLAVADAVENLLQPPVGGLYVVPVEHLDRVGAVQAIRAIEPDRFPMGLRPHGIDTLRGRLAMINRGFDRAIQPRTALIMLGPDPDAGDGRLAITREVVVPELCAANDVVLTLDGALVTIDRGTCPDWSTDEWLGIEFRGQLMRVPLAEERPPYGLLGGLAFPNGVELIEAGPYRSAVVAETRRRRLLISGPEGWTEVGLGGGPDNLSTDAEGMIVAAIHPSLSKLGLYRYGYTDSAPSRIVRVNPVNGEIEVLFDDPTGETFSAATSAVMSGPMLIAGSVRDRGLLICRFALG